MTKPDYIADRQGKSLPDEEKRLKQIIVRMSEDEKAYLMALAKQQGMQMAVYIRYCVFIEKKPVIVPEANREEWVKLAKLAGNLNVLARAANSGEILYSDEVLPAVTETLTELGRLRATLLGQSLEDDEP
jgi:hypothetical protein